MAETRDSIADIWGPRAPYRGEWPSRVDERTTARPDRWVPSACVLCSNGCGVEIGVRGKKIVGVRGRAEDHVNRGRLGPKGLHAWEANLSKDRLVRPLIRSRGKLKKASWDEAMDLVVAESRRVVDEFTAGAVAFYSTGQIFHEEYYTLGVLGKAGLGTPHMDGNTRLCTATAASALKETFGSDGQPASYADFDVTDAFLLVGHNMAETQTVLWSRVLDRRRGPKPPKLVVIDPRATFTAREADVHLAPRPGTNVAVLNGLLHLVIKEGRLDRDFIAAHTVGFDELARLVAAWDPRRVKEASGVPVERLRAAAKVLGQAPTLVSTVLQGVYQSNQATAAAVQVNNLNLIRGLIGKPGSGVLQMNGQPTSQNNREAGADGDLPGFRNWHNPEHVAELARLWNVDVDRIPHWAPPTHAMQIFRYCEAGSIRLLWIIATNPAVSLPELGRIRKILSKHDLFVVVQDAFPTETTELADVVLPAALWGEKTGIFTNADRSVHLSRKAVDPPGEAKSDLDIFLDYARRMDFRDKDGAPLIKWSDAEGAFEAWKLCSKGRPCDYSGMTYERLARGPIRWPCNDEHPDGLPRLYADGVFPTAPDYCEAFGHDLDTGGNVEPEHYRANDPAGRAFLKAVEYRPPHEQPDKEYPLWLTTGRVVYHFHTRTKTARSEALNAAAPEAFVEVSAEDAKKLRLEEGDVVEVASRRGRIEVPVRIGAIEPGVVFVPFHYGHWDDPDADRAANDLTLTEWDPVSKQPHFKFAAVRLTKVGVLGKAGEAVAEAVGGVASAIGKAAGAVASVAEPSPKRHLGDYLAMTRRSEVDLAESFEDVAEHHKQEPDIVLECKLLASWSREREASLAGPIGRYGEATEHEPDALRKALFHGPRSGGLGLLRDLHDLWLLANEAKLCWEVLHQAAFALRDEDLVGASERALSSADRQVTWLRTRIDQGAPQALVVPS